MTASGSDWSDNSRTIETRASQIGEIHGEVSSTINTKSRWLFALDQHALASAFVKFTTKRVAMSDIIEKYGWTAVPRSLSKLVNSRSNPKPSTALKVDDIDLPSSELVQQVMKYASDHLPAETCNHSMRVFYYGQAIRMQHFPEWKYSAETYLLACLLHDIGTTQENFDSTMLSFEFSGGFLALNLLKSLKAASEQAESVCETIIRHQDLGETGNVSALTAIIHFATVFDNAGLNPGLVHGDTIKDVVSKYPRNKWTGCFASVVRRECEIKPWSNTTRIEGFAEMVEANKLMEPYD